MVQREMYGRWKGRMRWKSDWKWRWEEGGIACWGISGSEKKMEDDGIAVGGRWEDSEKNLKRRWEEGETKVCVQCLKKVKSRREAGKKMWQEVVKKVIRKCKEGEKKIRRRWEEGEMKARRWREGEEKMGGRWKEDKKSEKKVGRTWEEGRRKREDGEKAWRSEKKVRRRDGEEKVGGR